MGIFIVLSISILVFNTTAIFMRKRLTFLELYPTILFGLVVSLNTDVFASFRHNAWGFFKPKFAEYSMLWITLGIYPAAAAMIINWYPYRSAWWKKVIYLIVWAIFSTAYEWLTLEVGILWHENWNLMYSFLMYPFIFYLLILHVHFYRWIKIKTSSDGLKS